MRSWYYVDSWDWHGTIPGASQIFASTEYLEQWDYEAKTVTLSARLPANTNRGYIWQAGAWRREWFWAGDMPRDATQDSLPAPSTMPDFATRAGGIAALAGGVMAGVVGLVGGAIVGAVVSSKGHTGSGTAIGAGVGLLTGATLGAGAGYLLVHSAAGRFAGLEGDAPAVKRLAA